MCMHVNYHLTFNIGNLATTFSKASGKEKGTLYQLRNLIHRTNVPSDPEDDIKSGHF